jgi:hypothetical protein
VITRRLLLFLVPVCMACFGCSTESGDQVTAPSQDTQGPPGGPCVEVAGLVGAIIHEGTPQNRVDQFANSFRFESFIDWFRIVIEFRVTGGNVEATEMALAQSSLTSERPGGLEVGGVYQVVFKQLVERQVATDFMETIPGIEVVGVSEWPTVVLFRVPKGRENQWRDRFEIYPIVDFTARRVVCPVGG